MAACPALTLPARRKRGPFVLTPRRLEANRRNAARSTGPRTADGKARVARNAIKHGFFVGQHKWTPEQHRDFAETIAGLREDFRPCGVGEESCVWIIAESYVRMAAMLRYENLAALRHHQEDDRALDARIAAADADEAARLWAYREELRAAGLWGPTIPGPREMQAILRYEGRLHRTIRDARWHLESLKNFRMSGDFASRKMQKQIHYSATPNNGPEVFRRASAQRFDDAASPRSGPEARRGTSNGTADQHESAKTNPLSSMFMGNRHERRRAKALARRRT